MSEWNKFKVGKPGRFKNDCQQFDSVSHTSHVSSAMNIVEAGEIRPSLVFDKSKLNKERILVSWLSPNHWSNGFRYGNIRFDFSFADIIKDKHFYWVEAISSYQPNACRILITDIDRDSQLDTYDPLSKDGPWWFDESEDEHYFNGKYCLEFMFEAPIKLRHLKKLDFVKHHDKFCSIHSNSPNNCSELGYYPPEGGAIFMTRAAVAGVDLSHLSSHFVRKNGKPSDELKSAFDNFVKITRKVAFSGTLTEKSKSRVAVMRAIMSAFTFGSRDEAKLLCAMFKDEASFDNVAARVFGDIVELKKWETLVDS